MCIIFTDIDECTEGISGCHQHCTNTVPGYTCSCDTEYTLNEDGHVCDGRCSYRKLLDLRFMTTYLICTAMWAQVILGTLQFRTTANSSCNIFLTTMYERQLVYFNTYKMHSNRKGEFYLSFCSYPIRQTSMNVPVIMVGVATCVTTPLEISTAHVDLDTHYKKTTLLVLVSVMQCYVL